MKFKIPGRGAIAAGLVLVGACVTGCGGEPDSATAAMVGDLMSPDGGVGGSGGSGGVKVEDPRVIYLFYADGNPLPPTDVNACHGTPPKFKCNFGSSLLDCQRQVQAYLDRWYAEFNVVFTFTRPTSGPFYTEVVSSGGGAWCGLDAKVGGVAPFLCKDIDGGVAYTFMGGDDAKQTAVIIAQEQAHLVGLEHTTSPHDVMLPTICTNCDGFENAKNTVKDDRCNRPTQNSYEMMKERLGVWTIGSKPSPFGCQTQSPPPSVVIAEPADGSAVGHDFTLRVVTRGDCAMTKVDVALAPQNLAATSSRPPFEWDLTNISGKQTIRVTATDSRGQVATSTITVNAPAASPAAEAGGCAVAGGAPGGSAIAGIALALALARRQRRA